jgi:perosamine synthetase
MMNCAIMESKEMNVPQFKSFIDKEDYRALEGVFENNYIAEGPFSKKFHDELLDIIGAKYGVFASNGTLALYLALKAIGIKPGDEVIVQNTTFIASANAVEMVGAKPIFVDVVSHDDLSIDLEKIVLTSKTKAIMICHLFGTACSNTKEVKKYCESNNILLVEDAAQALAITDLSGKHCGTFGKVGTFSFYADKTITTGEGGFVVTDDKKVYEKMLFLRNQGRKNSGTFIHPEIGYNFRITDMQGALGLSQLKKLPYIIKEKQKLYNKYFDKLKDHVDFLAINSNFKHVPFRVVVFVSNAEKTIELMGGKGIEGRSVFFPLNKQPCYDSNDDLFEESEKCYKKGICLPTWVGLSDDAINHVCKYLIEYK